MTSPPTRPDDGDGTSAPPKRAALRLSEADIIASARLDVLGDGSLKEALASAGDEPAGQLPPVAATLPAVDSALPMMQPPPAPPSRAAPLSDRAAFAQSIPQVQPFAPMPAEHAPDDFAIPPFPAGQAPSDMRPLPVGPQPAVEVSAILSALDAAETAAAAQTPWRAEGPPFFQASDLRAPLPGVGESVARGSLNAQGLAPGRAETNAANEGAAAFAAGSGDAGAAALALTPQALDAAAKLVADASAANEALESLRRLLERELPNPSLVTPPSPPPDAAMRAIAPPPIPGVLYPEPGEPMQPSPMAAPTRAAAAADPLTTPASRPALPAVASYGQTVRRSSFDVWGFLAGFGMALAAGVLLYLFMMGR
jgi:hypothetical protein